MRMGPRVLSRRRRRGVVQSSFVSHVASFLVMYYILTDVVMPTNPCKSSDTVGRNAKGSEGVPRRSVSNPDHQGYSCEDPQTSLSTLSTCRGRRDNYHYVLRSEAARDGQAPCAPSVTCCLGGTPADIGRGAEAFLGWAGAEGLSRRSVDSGNLVLQVEQIGTGVQKTGRGPAWLPSASCRRYRSCARDATYSTSTPSRHSRRR